MRSMIAKAPEFASTSNIRVSVGTWNVNGGKFFRSVAFKHELITDWLLDLPKISMQTKPGKNESDSRLLTIVVVGVVISRLRWSSLTVAFIMG